MFSLPNGKVAAAQVLFPVTLVSFVLFLFLAFQFTQIMRDREAMKQAINQQTTAVDEAGKIQSQLNALAIGTQKLADEGDKDAKGIIERMHKLGISVNMPPSGAEGAPGAPGASAAPVPPPESTAAPAKKGPMKH